MCFPFFKYLISKLKDISNRLHMPTDSMCVKEFFFTPIKWIHQKKIIKALSHYYTNSAIAHFNEWDFDLVVSISKCAIINSQLWLVTLECYKNLYLHTSIGTTSHTGDSRVLHLCSFRHPHSHFTRSNPLETQLIQVTFKLIRGSKAN